MRPQTGFGITSIPLDRFYWYADEVLYLDADDRRAFVWIMRTVDNHLVATETEKARKQAK